jgi:hypothetical protein
MYGHVLASASMNWEDVHGESCGCGFVVVLLACVE